MSSTYRLYRTVEELRAARIRESLTQLAIGAAAGTLLALSFIAWVCLH
jgi:hypothetical protein